MSSEWIRPVIFHQKINPAIVISDSRLRFRQLNVLPINQFGLACTFHN